MIVLVHVAATVIFAVIVSRGWIEFARDLRDGERGLFFPAALELALQLTVLIAIWF